MFTLAFAHGLLISGSLATTIKVWNPLTGNCLRTQVGHEGAVHDSVAGGRVAYSGSWDRTIRVWSTTVWECTRTLNGHTGKAHALALDDGMLFSGSKDWTVKVWSTEALECFHTLEGHTVVEALAVGVEVLFSGL